MYHYVRPYDASLPFFNSLDIDDFRKQLDYFGDRYRFLSQDLLTESLRSGVPVKNGVILTFDDGFRDHHRYVLPELVRRNIAGIFYVSTGPYSDGRLLDVHRTHLLLGKYGGKRINDALLNIVSDDMLSHGHIAEFHSETYRTQNNTTATNRVKRTLNYFISYEHRPAVMRALMDRFFPDEESAARDFYLTRNEIREMADAGMIIGSHTVTHACMSKIAAPEQEREIALSFGFLTDLLGKLRFRTFCHPYGGFHSFTHETVTLLDKYGCDFSFNVEPRDISREDLMKKRQFLPRFDCNAFPHGSCRSYEQTPDSPTPAN